MIWINKKLRDLREEEGFTLIELMVVVLIIAILIAIAIPTFLGARTRAQDRAAQSSVRNVVTNAKAVYTDNEDYEDAIVATLNAAEPSILTRAFNDASLGANEVSVSGDGGTGNAQTAARTKVFYAAALSSSGTCWYARESVDSASTPGLFWAKDASAPTCTAGAGATAFGADATDWKNTPGAALDIS